MAALHDVDAENLAKLSLDEMEGIASTLSFATGNSRTVIDQKAVDNFHHFATLSYEHFLDTATKFAGARPLLAFGGSVAIPRGAFALSDREGDLVQINLFADSGSDDIDDDENTRAFPLLSWNVAETAVLDDIRSTLAPGCTNVTAVPLCLIRNITRCTLSDTRSSVGHLFWGESDTVSLGMLVVGFGQDISMEVRYAYGHDHSRISDLHWGSDVHVCNETAARANDTHRSVVWAACYDDFSLETRVRAPPETWFAIYHLTATPIASLSSLTATTALDEKNVVVQQMRELWGSDDSRPIAYFTQYAYAHTQVKCHDFITLLRGLDLTVALAAQSLGLVVSVVPVWFRDRPAPQERFTCVPTPPAPPEPEQDWDPRPMDRRPLVGQQFFAPSDGFIDNIDQVVAPEGEDLKDPKMIRWVNFPQHFEAGSVCEADRISPDGEARLCAWCAMAILIGQPDVANRREPEIEGTEDPMHPDDTLPNIQAFQGALESAFTSVPWMCQDHVAVNEQSVRVGVISEFPFIQSFPPESASDLARFVAACMPASFGRGREAVTDASYRKALVLEVDQVAVDWHPAPNILPTVERLLTPNMPPLRAVLGKVNVYGAGDFFKSHVDTPRDVNMVGTLVVCLPCEHTGGELRLKHEGKDVLVDMSDGIDYPMAVMRWCAFFSDVEHEVLPVKSGFRVTLTYDLVADLVAATASDGAVQRTVHFGPEGQLAVLPRALPMIKPASASVVQSVLDSLTRILGVSRSQWVGIFCSHAYPLTSRGLVEQKLLKGVDALLWRAVEDEGYDLLLKQACRFDAEETIDAETDPNCPVGGGDDGGGPRYDRYAIANKFSGFYESSGDGHPSPPWISDDSGGNYMRAVHGGITFLNKPRHLLAVGAWDHIMGNWPLQPELFYGTMVMLIRVPTHRDRAWERRKLAVRNFVALHEH